MKPRSSLFAGMATLLAVALSAACVGDHASSGARPLGIRLGFAAVIESNLEAQGCHNVHLVPVGGGALSVAPPAHTNLARLSSQARTCYGLSPRAGLEVHDTARGQTPTRPLYYVRPSLTRMRGLRMTLK